MTAKYVKEKLIRYMEPQAKHPASKSSYLKFNPVNWWADTRTLSLPAKALWFEILLLMHISPKRGYLLNQDGAAISARVLAIGLGVTIEVVQELCKELEGVGVFDRSPERVPFSRRMVREQARFERELALSKKQIDQTKLDELLLLSRKRGVDTDKEMSKLQCYLIAHPEKVNSLKTIASWMSNAKPTYTEPKLVSSCDSPRSEPLDYSDPRTLGALIAYAESHGESIACITAGIAPTIIEKARQYVH